MALDITGIGTAVTAAKDILGMFFPDKTEKEKAEMASVMVMVQGQLDTNKIEAAHPSLLVAGWRPAVGWVCVFSLAAIYIPKALVLTSLWTYQALRIVSAWNGESPVPVLPVYPELGVSDLIGLLGALLGMGAMRTYEKKNEVATTLLNSTQ